MKNFWIRVGVAVVIVTVTLAMSQLPFREPNSVTLVLPSKGKQVATAKALAAVMGEPDMTLNTQKLDRFIFSDGTSVDLVKFLSEQELIYDVVALKTITLGFLSFKSPIEEAKKLADRLKREGYPAQVITRPDSAFPDGSIVLVLSDAFRANYNCQYGFAVLIRKNAFRVGGQRPQRFKGF